MRASGDGRRGESGRSLDFEPSTATGGTTLASVRLEEISEVCGGDYEHVGPIFRGAYPKIFLEAWPDWPAREVEALCEPIDFLGIDYITGGVIRSAPQLPPLRATRVRQPHSNYTDVECPAGLSEALRWVSERYGGLPIYVTENGAAFYDPSRAERPSGSRGTPVSRLSEPQPNRATASISTRASFGRAAA